MESRSNPVAIKPASEGVPTSALDLSTTPGGTLYGTTPGGFENYNVN